MFSGGEGAESRPPVRDTRTVPLTSFTADAVASLPGPDWLRQRRAAAFERFAAADLPTEAEEVWRFSRINDLDLDRYAPVATPADGESVTFALPAALQAVIAAAGPIAGTLVLRNGRVESATLEPAVAAQGVTLGPLADVAGGEDLLDLPSADQDAFVDLNAAFTAEPVILRVPSGVVVEHPVLIVQWIDVDGAAVLPRVIVEAGEASQVTLLDWSGSADVAALVAPVVEIRAEAAANVRHLNIQDLGPRVWQLGYSASRVARDATLLSAAVALGGDYARIRTDSKLTGAGATANLLAVYFGDGAQVHDFRTLQDHDAPKTTSDLLFKGAVGGSSRSVYSGLIRVRKGASGTNAFQTNRNLVLSEGAHADSVPNLEIEENDVRCSHASAVGPVDEDQRYYLESRGVPPEAAQRLIILGFFDEILERTPIAGLRPLLRLAVVDKLAKADQ